MMVVNLHDLFEHRNYPPQLNQACLRKIILISHSTGGNRTLQTYERWRDVSLLIVRRSKFLQFQLYG